MASGNGLLLAYEGALTTPAESSKPFLITVLFTSTPATLTALKRAASLANELNARIELVVPQTVPYPLPLQSPPVLIEFCERRFRTIAEKAHVDATVHIYLCRDPGDVYATVLHPHSVIVLGGHRRWWPTSAMRLARALTKAGHEVIFTELERRHDFPRKVKDQ